jgi:uncharacterized damage-inducible protein DinB
MTEPATARLLARYNDWANARLFEAVAALPAGEAEKPRPSLFKSMIGTLNHNLVVALIWQAHLERREHGFKARNLVLHAGLEPLRRAQKDIDDWYIAWAGAQAPEALNELLDFRFISGTAGRMTRGEMLLHVVNHNSYHRGWVVERFAEVPMKTPDLDLPVYCGTIR